MPAHMTIARLGAVAAFAAMATPVFAQEDVLSDQEAAAVRALIEEHLIANPEILERAFIALQERRARAAEADAYARIAAQRDALIDEDRDVVVGPSDAPVTIVEFFDYNCGFCKSSSPWVREQIDTHGGRVRVVFKELPLLDGRFEGSDEASRAALAAARQGRKRYLDMHFALMAFRGALTSDQIDAIAREADVDVARMRQDMGERSLGDHVDANLAFAQSVGITGTPFFVVNDRAITGADLERLSALVAQGLAGAGG